MSIDLTAKSSFNFSLTYKGGHGGNGGSVYGTLIEALNIARADISEYKVSVLVTEEGSPSHGVLVTENTMEVVEVS